MNLSEPRRVSEFGSAAFRSRARLPLPEVAPVTVAPPNFEEDLAMRSADIARNRSRSSGFE